MAKPKPTAEIIAARLASKSYFLSPTGCRIWTGHTYANGYGQIGLNGKCLRVHRVAWEIKNGPIPQGLFVCHRCDTILCIETDHLFLGTAKDNIQDAVRKGRMAHGNSHYSRTNPERLARGDNNGSRKHKDKMPRGDSHYSRLHPEKLARGLRHGSQTKPGRLPRGVDHPGAKFTVDEILSIREDTRPIKVIAAHYGTSKSAIERIKNRKCWKHI